jgi:hypothetical protein
MKFDLIAALAVNTTVFVVMAITSIKLARRTPQAGNSEVPSQVESDSNLTFLQIAFAALLAFCCVALLIITTGIFVGFTSVDDIWEFMRIAVPAETLALGYYHTMKR